jgi:hypothetical protein
MKTNEAGDIILAMAQCLRAEPGQFQAQEINIGEVTGFKAGGQQPMIITAIGGDGGGTVTGLRSEAAVIVGGGSNGTAMDVDEAIQVLEDIAAALGSKGSGLTGRLERLGELALPPIVTETVRALLRVCGVSP